MAPEPPKQKRKRGRPSGASVVGDDASGRESQKAQRTATKGHRADHEEHDAEEASRPRKRGRPSKSHETTQTAIAVSEKAPRRKKGRVSDAGQEEEEVDRENAEAKQPNNGAQKRSRPLKESVSTGNKMRKEAVRRSEVEEAQEEEEDPPSSGLRRSNRERRSWNAEEIFSAKIPSKEPVVETAPEPSRPRKRARASKTVPDEEDGQAPTETETSRPRKKRSRPSAEAEAEAEAEQPPAEGRVKRRGRPPASAGQEAVQEESSQPRRRGRPRTSDASQQERVPSKSQEPARRRSRRSSGDEAPSSKPRARKARPSEPEPAAEGEEPAYRHLKSQTRQVSRRTIEAKWAPLNPPAIAAITTLLSDAQRPVLHRLQDTRSRREHATAALSTITRRLRHKLAKGMPFPPPTATAATAAGRSAAEDDFDFERAVDGIQALENTLNPLLHSVALLEREAAREQAALDKDHVALKTLEANAKAEARGWRERGKREHPLAPPVKRAGEDEAAAEQPLELVKPDGLSSGSVFQDLEDEELISISKQIGSHMDSMKGNLQQIDGIVQAITKSKAALQRTLHENLDAQQYEQVLLG